MTVKERQQELLRDYQCENPKDSYIAISNGCIMNMSLRDAVGNSISLDLPAKEIRARLKAWRPRRPKETRGALAKYARLVASASEGAVTDKHLNK